MHEWNVIPANINNAPFALYFSFKNANKGLNHRWSDDEMRAQITGKAMQKTEIPVIPIDRASGRLESNQPDMTASFELMDAILSISYWNGHFDTFLVEN